jgi:site-specific recombinase XerD
MDEQPQSTALTPQDPTPTLLEPQGVSGNPAVAYIAGLGHGSRRTMTDALNTLAGLLSGGTQDAFTLPWGDLRSHHVDALRARLIDEYKPGTTEHYAPATVNKMLSALRGVLKKAFRLHLMPAEEYTMAKDVECVDSDTLPRGRMLAQGELHALFMTCAKDASYSGRRDAAIFGLMFGAGLRRSEVVALDLANFDPESGALTLRSSKGNKDRLVYTSNGSKTALDRWLEVRGEEEGALFCRIRKTDKLVAGRLTDQAVHFILDTRRRQAGLKATSPHDARRTYISTLWDNGVDAVTIAKLAGHSDIKTTQKYDRRGEEAKRRATETIYIPYCE